MTAVRFHLLYQEPYNGQYIVLEPTHGECGEWTLKIVNFLFSLMFTNVNTLSFYGKSVLNIPKYSLFVNKTLLGLC